MGHHRRRRTVLALRPRGRDSSAARLLGVVKRLPLVHRLRGDVIVQRLFLGDEGPGEDLGEGDALLGLPAELHRDSELLAVEVPVVVDIGERPDAGKDLGGQAGLHEELEGCVPPDLGLVAGLLCYVVEDVLVGCSVDGIDGPGRIVLCVSVDATPSG